VGKVLEGMDKTKVAPRKKSRELQEIEEEIQKTLTQRRRLTLMAPEELHMFTGQQVGNSWAIRGVVTVKKRVGHCNRTPQRQAALLKIRAHRAHSTC
jgi:hypothetical protein